MAATIDKVTKMVLAVCFYNCFYNPECLPFLRAPLPLPPLTHTLSPCFPLPPSSTLPLPSSFVNVATESGFTPLHYAVASNFPNLVALLLSNGASMCCRTSVPEGYDILSCENWSTPLHLAAMKGRTVCTLELLKHCVSVT